MAVVTIHPAALLVEFRHALIPLGSTRIIKNFGVQEPPDMKSNKIGLGSLKSVKVLFEGDVYDLACLLLKAHNAKDQRTGFRSRPTVHGLATRYSMLTDISTDAIIEVFNRHGLPLGATVESDIDE